MRRLRKPSETILLLRFQLSPVLSGPPLLQHPPTLPPGLGQNGTARALAARQEPVPRAREPAGGGARGEERLERPGIGWSRLLEPRACVFCLPRSSGGAGDGCAPRADQSEASRCRPVTQRLVRAQLLSGTKADGGKKRRGWGEKKKKKAQTAVTDRLGERSGLRLPGDRRGSR